MNSYVKTDDNRMINEKYIRWIKKIDECLYVCNKSRGCVSIDTHRICKVKNPSSYARLNAPFQDVDALPEVDSFLDTKTHK